MTSVLQPVCLKPRAAPTVATTPAPDAGAGRRPHYRAGPEIRRLPVACNQNVTFKSSWPKGSPKPSVFGAFDLGAKKYTPFTGQPASLDRFVQMGDAERVFTLKMRPTKVRLRLIKSSATRRHYLLVLRA